MKPTDCFVPRNDAEPCHCEERSDAAVNSARMTMTTTPLMQDLVIGYGTTIEGTVHSLGKVYIHGCVMGHIQAQTVVCSHTADVHGHIVCEQLDMAGKLDGSFDTDEAFIRAGACVCTFEDAVCTGTCRIEGTFSGELKAGRILLQGAGEINRMPRPQAPPKHPTTPQEPCSEQGT